ncbi:hypothetical protein [Tenacibaculum holothuriorum]|uniref:hypothetical protein n=1 Tax=Tenacibaculum holothuriorum TaxID=1635173 RepID=UPI0013024018|nr:hypothetical protein [Tenacibaculum holothuriorum]
MSFWIPKKLGNRKLGIIISRILTLVVVLLILSFVFDDYLFFKSDVKKYLSEHKIELNDDFKILHNENGGVRDYYHKFEIEISDLDKERLIEQIKSADNFTDTISGHFYFPQEKERFIGKLSTINYEKPREFKIEYFKPNGKGIAPTYRIISISKLDNKLVFEDIID